MPRIPQLNTPVVSHIQQPNLSLQRPRNISTPKAAPARVVSSGKELLAPALQGASEALYGLSQVFAEKEELARVAKSQEIQMGANEVFRNLWLGDAKKTGGQTVGMLQDFVDKEEDLRGVVIPEDLDVKTNRELTDHFNRQFTRHATKLTEHTIQQSKVADATARTLSVQDAKKNIFDLSIGDTKGIDQEVNNVLNAEMQRHPNLTKNQIALNSRALKEDFVNYALTKWASSSPIATAAFWGKNQTYLKNALPNTYSKISKNMEQVKEDASYDQALLLLSKMDSATAADIIIKDDKGVFGLSGQQRFRLSSLFQARHKYEVAEEIRKDGEREDTYLLKSHERYYNQDTKKMNVPAALVDTEQAYRDKDIDYSTYINRSNNLRKGAQLLPERSLEVTRKINDREITTKGQILREIEDTNASPIPFYATLDKRIADDKKGFTNNYFNEAYKRYTELSNIKKISKLPEESKEINEEDLLVDPLKMGDFKRDLENYARQMSYSAGDPRILELADKMLKSAWYGGNSIRTIGTEPQELHYGEAPWHVFGEEVGRAWELPEFEESLNLQSATGGNQTKPKQWTPDEQTAYKMLTEAKIQINDTTLKQMTDRIVYDREHKE